MEHRLQEAPYLAGDEYTIADIATFPWVRNPDRRGIDLADYPSVKRWHDAIAARPAVQRGVAVLADRQRQGSITDSERENLFGRTQFAAR
jgi:GST-like protein